MSELTNTISLVIGDWSGDGHMRTETVVVKSNLNAEEVAQAYEAASKELGFNFIDEVAAEYEENEIPVSMLRTLMERGLKLEDIFPYEYDLNEAKAALAEGDEDDDDAEGVGLWVDAYAKIYCFIVKQGNKDFEYEVIPEDDQSRIDIGGYGLFFS